ncbi:protein of unknown function [Paraburkholderia dioscoreae]|uniref:Uncharacterized protein n=1 Tax=Paraburkholderia dioscoreae TaxID=2604047 RepID=A0A5Q4Z7C1_9BURK|nr:protein of unknown function [Paraburkholderia dioscoreae]
MSGLHRTDPRSSKAVAVAMPQFSNSAAQRGSGSKEKGALNNAPFERSRYEIAATLLKP